MSDAQEAARDGYQALAIAIVEQALVDAAWQPRLNLIGRMTSRLGEKDRARVSAEQFLWRRTDRTTQVWFALAGLNLAAFRASATTAEARQRRCAEVRARLAAMRASEGRRGARHGLTDEAADATMAEAEEATAP
jgi:hypothetical protein